MAALNQSTRPKKKSKEEKKKEREEKDKLRQEQRKQMKDAIIKEIRKSDEKTDKGGLSDEAAKRKNATELIRNGLISIMQPPTYLDLHEMKNLEKVIRARDKVENITRIVLKSLW